MTADPFDIRCPRCSRPLTIGVGSPSQACDDCRGPGRHRAAARAPIPAGLLPAQRTYHPGGLILPVARARATAGRAYRRRGAVRRWWLTAGRDRYPPAAAVTAVVVYALALAVAVFHPAARGAPVIALGVALILAVLAVAWWSRRDT